MKEYTAFEIKCIVFSETDIITASGFVTPWDVFNEGDSNVDPIGDF